MSQPYPELFMLVNGERISAQGRETEEVFNPATGATLAELPHATEADLAAAVDGAAGAFEKWRTTSAFDRAVILRKTAGLLRERREHIATILTLEQGKPLGEARLEVDTAANVFEWFAEEGRRAYGRLIPSRNRDVELQVRRGPIGPCALFTAWNFPADLPARKLAAALAAGCTAVIKPAEQTPATALEIAKALIDAGTPAGVINVVFGKPAMISEYLLRHPAIRKASFTGSANVGRHLARLAADGVKPMTLELGGHAPVIVLDDADIDRIAMLAATAKFRNAGQICISPNRFFVQNGVYSRFVERFTDHARSLTVGDGMAEGSQMGPLAHRARMEWMERLVQDATENGAKVATGGARLGEVGYFWAPTVLTELSNQALVLNAESFGPIAPVVRFSKLDEALAEVNRLPYGLAAYAFTNDLKATRRISDACECGMLGINTFAIALAEAPFGGVRESGYGSENGSEGLESYLVNKLVVHST
jgi:succinate-semialdehyde dehydrogenase/glutarate-semialdehyde dehydrogenase